MLVSNRRILGCTALTHKPSEAYLKKTKPQLSGEFFYPFFFFLFTGIVEGGTSEMQPFPPPVPCSGQSGSRTTKGDLFPPLQEPSVVHDVPCIMMCYVPGSEHEAPKQEP